VYLCLVLGALFSLMPFVWMLSSSLKTVTQEFVYPPVWIPHPVVWGNYVAAWVQIAARVVANTFIFTVSIVVLQGFLATCGGFAFARLRFPARDKLFLVYMGTMMIPPQLTMIPTYIEVVRLGWNDSFLGLVVPILAQAAFGTFLFRQYFLGLPEELYDAAELDGAGYWTQYWRLTLPLAGPALSAYGMITFLTAWNMYMWPLIVVRSQSMKVLPMVIAELSNSNTVSQGVVMAAATISFLPVLLVFVFAQKWFVRGIAMTGLK
jgi:ABC-type glycerol-3-phosphate transport system permease component